MKNNNVHYVPYISTHAGATLTAQNWLEVGISWVCCELAPLLMKPGCTFLRQLPNLSTFIGWPGKVILDASLPLAKNKSQYKIQSVYDGRIQTFELDELLNLIDSLKPDAVLLPECSIEQSEMVLSKQLPNTIILTPAKNKPDHWYLAEEHPIYMTDEAACDGLNGILYTQSGKINITDSKYAMQFDLIDANCKCPVCQQQFTLAYFNHLYSHTPLLCQRLLIMHNTYTCCQ